MVWYGLVNLEYTKIPVFDELEHIPYAKYLHICSNKTIQGIEFKNYLSPKNQNGVLVAYMSANFCSKPTDISKIGNLRWSSEECWAIRGHYLVITKKDLIRKAQEIAPLMLDYRIHYENNSLYNTPPCFSIYMCGRLVFEDLLERGGLKEVEKKNKNKAEMLYSAIDGSNGFYKYLVEKLVRSLMNVQFTLERSEMGAKFIQEEEERTWFSSKGTNRWELIYNAMPLAGVEKLVAFMKDFQARHA